MEFHPKRRRNEHRHSRSGGRNFVLQPDAALAIASQCRCVRAHECHAPSKALHSALVCLKTKAEVRDQTIVLQVDTGVFRSGKSALCPPAELGPIAPGDYTVVYGDEAQPLGRVSIAP